MAETNQIKAEEKADEEKEKKSASNSTMKSSLFYFVSLLEFIVVVRILESSASCLREGPETASHEQRRA